jgi:Uma2 family endonuclease
VSITEVGAQTGEPSPWDGLLRLMKRLDPTGSRRAEIIEGVLTLTDLTERSEAARQMSVARAETAPRVPSRWEVVLRAWEQLDLPEGWRAEIIEGDIHIMTPSTNEHGHIVSLLHRQLIVETMSPGSGVADAEIYQAIGMRLPVLDNHYIPDLLVLPSPAPGLGADQVAEDALLVVEVTSKSTAHKDRKAKLWGYAHAGVPLYLLVDRWDPETGQGEVTLYSDPANGVYTTVAKTAFGKEIRLPAPFDLTVDTSGFPTD